MIKIVKFMRICSALLLMCVSDAGYAATTDHAATTFNRGDAEKQLAVKDKVIADLIQQVNALQARLAATKSAVDLKTEPTNTAHISTATDLVYSKTQAHSLFARRDKTITALRRQVADLQAAVSAINTGCDAPPPVAIEAKPPAIPHYHYERVMEMKLEPSVSFKPWGIALDAHGQLYVAGEDLGIRVYDDGTYQRSIGYPDMADARQAVDASGVPIDGDDDLFGPKTDPILRAKLSNGQDFVLIDNRYTMEVAGHLWQPGAIFVSGERVVAVDNYTETIQIFKNGIRSVCAHMGPPPGGRDSNGRFTGVAYTDDNHFFVLDAANNCLIDDDLEPGKLIQVYGGKGTGKSELLGPISMAYQPSTQEIYICDASHHRVVVFDKAGAYVSSFGSEGSGDGQFKSMGGIALDKDGRIFVGDKNRIEVFAPDGSYLTQFGPVPKEATDVTPFGQLMNVYSLAVDKEGVVYASDPDAYNIKVYTLDHQ